jgi:hypothetical protein
VSSLNGVIHSTAYEELAKYRLAVKYFFLENENIPNCTPLIILIIEVGPWSTINIVKSSERKLEKLRKFEKGTLVAVTHTFGRSIFFVTLVVELSLTFHSFSRYLS